MPDDCVVCPQAINMAKMEEKIDNIIRRLDDNKEDHVEMMDKMESYVDSADKKFARKELEIKVESLSRKLDDRDKDESKKSYDWVKYAVTTIVSIVVVLLLNKLTK